MSSSITCTVDEFPSGDGEFLSAWQVGEALLLPHRRGLKPEDLEMSIELKYTSDEYRISFGWVENAQGNIESI